MKVSILLFMLSWPIWLILATGVAADEGSVPGREGGSAQDLLYSKGRPSGPRSKPSPAPSGRPAVPLVNMGGNNYGTSSKAGIKLPFE